MVRVLADEDFLPLLNLYIEMYKTIDNTLGNSVIAAILAGEMQQPHFRVYGVFLKDTLVGFIAGYDESPTSFFSTGLYCSSPIKVKELVDYVENDLKANRYISWSTEVRGHITNSIVPKLGAKIDNIRYKKEL